MRGAVTCCATSCAAPSATAKRYWASRSRSCISSRRSSSSRWAASTRNCSERRELILSTIQDEEKRFRRTLDNGIRLLNEMLESGTVQETRVLPGADAFMLYDTYGFPFQLTEELAA